ncbi:hypothetical protein NOGI109294_07750 [Nocardiopsis gilva]|uniref:hypothetical protein n=1 Tax=Nocardiopsis gilva TaxID=280236 RepID=UPI001268EAA9|nr:hypothetical protein [Nocardiopsis gilva]
MSYSVPVSVPTRPRRNDHLTPTAPAHTPLPADRPAVSTADEVPPGNDIDGIGDIVLAGRPSGYAHLAARPIATAGRLVAAARAAASALALAPSSLSRRFRRHRGHWYIAPRPVRRAVDRGLRVEVAALAPGEAAELPERRHRPATRRGVALHLVYGDAHLITPEDDGDPVIRPFAAGSTRLLGTGNGHRLVNTGAGPALAVRVLV